jgi:predicted DNA-binding protein
MSRRKISTTVYITPKQDEQLKILSQRLGRPVAEFIREGIDLAVKRYSQHLPKQLDLLGEPEESADN